MSAPEGSESTKKEKEGEKKWQDQGCKTCSIVGAVVLLPCLVPQLPWRCGGMNPTFAGRFTPKRFYSPFGATNHQQKYVTWTKLKSETCLFVQQVNTPNPLNLALTVATAVVETGGAVAGCGAWQNCKDHAMARCSEYLTISITGITNILLLFLSIIFSFCIPFTMSAEAKAKKAKRKEEAKQKTMTFAITAFAASFVGVIAWLGATEVGFKNLQSTGYYPWPAMYVGAYLAGFGVFIQFLAMLCGILRNQPEEEKEEQYVDAQGEGDMANPHMGAMAPGMHGDMAPGGHLGAMPPPGMYGQPPMGGPYDPMMGQSPMPPPMMGGYST